MKQQPKYRKFNKPHLPKKTVTTQKLKLKNSIGLQSTEAKLIPFKQIEEARRAIIRSMGKEGNLLIRVFPSFPLTKFPADVRMGGGKGRIDEWQIPVKKGTIVFEISNVSEIIAKQAFKKAKFKLRFKHVVIQGDK